MTENAPAPLPGRNAARFAILAPQAAFLLMCVFRQLSGTDTLTPSGRFWFYTASTLATGLIAAGAVAGVIGLVRGIRSRSWDTSIIAGLGLFVTSVLTGVILLALIFARQAG
ncbi:hypothetical protein [Lignipirellula cremea]|uniref:DUF4190 domain-containing protein n=1 Tax=Lignipirellula cremea TaxID=2528010 RepID=A0A518DZJ6_9BACT|nr:hypothetical protein [Lignipirellula cremea]QDU97266.1 hypothetical protein Pla8534_51110 [Lignipirellula cremea]